MNPIHASEIRCYQRCPREWQHVYRDRRVPLHRPEALTRGTDVHLYLNGWWRGDTEIPLPSDPIARACCLGYHARYQKPHLSCVEVEKPFTAIVGGVECAGTLDVLGVDPCPDSDPCGQHRQVIVEHKTTSSDLRAGGYYWREVVHTNLQVSMYLAAYPDATILYDVIRKPQLRKLRAGKPNEETDDELVTRCLAAMAEDPEKYFARFTVVRLQPEIGAFAEDVAIVDDLRRRPNHPRNPSSCYSFGRECGYFGVCWEGKSIDDDSVYGPNMHGVTT